MHIAIPEADVPATLVLGREPVFSDAEYVGFCEANPDLRVERTAAGEIVIAPPAGGESDYRNARVIFGLGLWVHKTRRGVFLGSSVQFMLPDGSALSPDSAWVSRERLARLTKKQRREFLRIVPEFVVEVMSPSDRPGAAQRKMRQWMDNGVELAWLIDGDNRRVYVYRQGQPVRELSGIERIEGEGPVEGFVLDLTEIWEGL